MFKTCLTCTENCITHACARTYIYIKVNKNKKMWSLISCPILFWCFYGWLFFFEIVDGKAVMSREILEKVDNENQSVTYNVIGGVLKETYQSFKFIVQAIPKDEGSLVRWTLIYEKLNVDVPDPNAMLQFGIDVTTEIDAYLTQEELEKKTIAWCIWSSTICFSRKTRRRRISTICCVK